MLTYPLAPDVPVMNSTVNEKTRPVYLQELQKIQAHRLWIAPDRELLFDGILEKDRISLEENIRYFRENGMEVGLWIQAFGFGVPLEKKVPDWARLKSVTGHEMPQNDAFCPEDPAFTAAYLDHVRSMAALKPDLLMLDDDLCMSVRPGIGCFCDRHMRLLEEALGEKLNLEELPEKIFTCGPNRYRDVWYQVMGDTMRRFCQKVRLAVDEINPDLRVGFCAGYTSWDFEGADAVELTKILAGKNEPFLRFTGAPYWCSRVINRFPGQKQNAVIECARQQNVWCADSGVEVFAEADSYPRPCYHVNASYIENFDLAIRAEGARSLKYMFDYFATPAYEKQYLKIHNRNLPFYEKIDSAFRGKKSAGVQIFAPMKRIRNAVLPEEFMGEGELMRLFFSMSAAMLTGLGIPVCYKAKPDAAAGCSADSSAGNEIMADHTADCGAAFGEEVLMADPLKYEKMILDLPAARLLEEKGIDCGLADWSRTAIPSVEVFVQDRKSETPVLERILLSDVGKGAPFAKTGGFYQVQCKEGAQTESYFEAGASQYPSSYRYHNGTTEFLVFTFDGLAVGESSSIFASYCRQNQIMDFVGGEYPFIRGFSEVYSLCARSQDSKKTAVLFENLSMDPIFDFEIELGRACAGYTLTGAVGQLSEDRKRIMITSDFGPSSVILLEADYD